MEEMPTGDVWLKNSQLVHATRQGIWQGLVETWPDRFATRSSEFGAMPTESDWPMSESIFPVSADFVSFADNGTSGNVTCDLQLVVVVPPKTHQGVWQPDKKRLAALLRVFSAPPLPFGESYNNVTKTKLGSALDTTLKALPMLPARGGSVARDGFVLQQVLSIANDASEWIMERGNLPFGSGPPARNSGQSREGITIVNYRPAKHQFPSGANYSSWAVAEKNTAFPVAIETTITMTVSGNPISLSCCAPYLANELFVEGLLKGFAEGVSEASQHVYGGVSRRLLSRRGGLPSGGSDFSVEAWTNWHNSPLAALGKKQNLRQLSQTSDVKTLSIEAKVRAKASADPSQNLGDDVKNSLNRYGRVFCGVFVSSLEFVATAKSIGIPVLGYTYRQSCYLKHTDISWSPPDGPNVRNGFGLLGLQVKIKFWSNDQPKIDMIFNDYGVHLKQALLTGLDMAFGVGESFGSDWLLDAVPVDAFETLTRMPATHTVGWNTPPYAPLWRPKNVKLVNIVENTNDWILSRNCPVSWTT